MRCVNLQGTFLVTMKLLIIKHQRYGKKVS